MVSEKELNEFLLGSFGLICGQIVTGKEVWNNIIEKQKYLNVIDFLGIEGERLEKSLILDDSFINNLFGLDTTGFDEKEIEKLSGDYMIVSAKLEPDYYQYDSRRRNHLMKIYVKRKIAKGTKWSAGERVLLTYRLDIPEEEI